MIEPATISQGAVARPLAVLIPLIKDDLQHASEAAQQAGMPYYKAAGEKLIEAKVGMKKGEFGPWIKRHFRLSYSHAERYMKYARATADMQFRRSDELPNFSQVMRERGDPTYGTVVRKRPWHDDVKQISDRAKAEAARIRDAELTRQQERDAEKKLALRLIDIGFKVLAKELHPDKGGSRDAMARLNRVRSRLQQSA